MTQEAKRRFTVLALVVAGAAASTLLTACNTVQGVGEDIRSAGEAGERAIDGDADHDGK